MLKSPVGCRYKEAINECSSALELNPSYSRALVRRAKAYEQMQHYKQALSDLQKINRGDDATADTRVRQRVRRSIFHTICCGADLVCHNTVPAPMTSNDAVAASGVLFAAVRL